MLLPVRGLQLNAIERGSGETTLLLHGWLDHAHSFDLLAELLPGRTVALDFRGHGDSQWAPLASFYHLVEYLGDVDAVLEQTGATRIVGHSMGGAVALLYAAARPDRLRHVTLLDSAPLTIQSSEIPARVSAWLDDLKMPRARRRVASVEDAAARMMRFNAGLTAASAHLLAQHGVSPDGDGLAWKWDPWLRAHSPLPFTEGALQALLPCVQAPVLLLRAGKGMTAEAPELQARLSGVPKLRIETVPDAGHHLHLDAPAEVARRIVSSWGTADQQP
jgi:pimeloyl-ACP methyl ester carboxylesterase